MNYRVITIAACFLAAMAAKTDAGMILSDFNYGTLQGWSKQEPFGGTLTNPGSGGNPGGYLIATDSVARGGLLLAVAPHMFSGDLSRFIGLAWDEFVVVRGAGGSRVVRPTELFLVGGDTPTSYRMSSNPLTVMGAWNPRFVEFKASNFSLSGILANGSESFEDTIQNVSMLAIQLDTSTMPSGPESGIDNVRLVRPVPEPSSISLFGFLAITLAGAHYRRVTRR